MTAQERDHSNKGRKGIPEHSTVTYSGNVKVNHNEKMMYDNKYDKKVIVNSLLNAMY